MRWLVLTMASSDPGDSDIVEFSNIADMDEFVRQMEMGGAHEIIVFKKEPGLRTDIGGGRVWTPEDNVRGERLREIARGVPR